MKRSHRIAVLMGFMFFITLTNTASAMYGPTLGRFLQRDPAGYVDSANSYEYARSSPLIARDPRGLESIYDAPKPDHMDKCAGTCGADITDWMKDEIASQMKGWDAYKAGYTKRRGVDPGYYQYAWWAYNNQFYKDFTFGGYNQYPTHGNNFKYDFSAGTSCGKKGPGDNPNAPECGQSVTLCGQCVHKSVLGNLMFGLMAKHAGQDLNMVTDYVEAQKGKGQKDPYDPPIFKVGFDSFNPAHANFGAGGDFCTAVLTSAKAQGVSLQWLGKGNGKKDVVDRSPCRPCNEMTNEKHHGGGYTVNELKAGLTGTYFSDNGL